MTDTERALLRQDEVEMYERAEKATPGPWHQGNELNLQIFTEANDEGECVADVCGLTCGGSAETNTLFIAHARTDLPKLLHRIAAGRTEERNLRELIVRYGNHLDGCIFNRSKQGIHVDCTCGLDVARRSAEFRLAAARAGEGELLEKVSRQLDDLIPKLFDHDLPIIDACLRLRRIQGLINKFAESLQPVAESQNET